MRYSMTFKKIQIQMTYYFKKIVHIFNRYAASCAHRILIWWMNEARFLYQISLFWYRKLVYQIIKTPKLFPIIFSHHSNFLGSSNTFKLSAYLLLDFKLFSSTQIKLPSFDVGEKLRPGGRGALKFLFSLSSGFQREFTNIFKDPQNVREISAS